MQMANSLKTSESMKVCVVGLGYVGSVFAACVSEIDNVSVCGVDSVEEKVSCINQGTAPLYETGLTELVKRQVKEGKLTATTNLKDGIKDADYVFICVGTPNRLDGHLDTSQIFSIVARITDIQAETCGNLVIAIRSTVSPGTCRNLQDLVEQILLQKKARCNIRVTYCPEFLREGSAIKDYHYPPYVIIGVPKDFPVEIKSDFNHLFSNVTGNILYCSINTSESIKSVSNTWHALKVAFANEISCIAKALDVDSYELMEIFSQDTKLNISTLYLKPGPPYGGSCLTKDLAGLKALADSKDLTVPVISSISSSNQLMLKNAVAKIRALSEGRPVLLMGLSFKVGTDDLRASPSLYILDRLLESFATVYWHDVQVITSLNNHLHALPMNRLLTKKHIEAMVEKPEDLITQESPLCVVTRMGDTESLGLLESLGASFVELANI